MEQARARFVGCQGILWALMFFMVLPTLHVLASENVNNPDDDQSTAPRLYFEPIAGLTTTRHLAPGETAIPLGTVLELFLEVPGDAQVSFSGATVTSRNSEGIKATCLLDQVGPVLVAAISEMSDGTRHMSACRLDVVAIAIGDISATVTTPTVARFDLDESATNADTMSAYFGESIAGLVETTTQLSGAVALDGGRRRPGPASATRRFRTSTFRRINFHAEVSPLAFAPLMEWRIDGLGAALGAEKKETFTSVGAHTVSVGPTDRPIGAMIDTYSVSIVSHDSGHDILPEGEWITFEAVTDPPGFEGEINWVSSTKYGIATPVVGQGPTFTALFDDTFGPHDKTGEPFQWLGVRADNALFGQDQKPALECEPACEVDEVCSAILNDDDTVSAECFFAPPAATGVCLIRVRIFPLPIAILGCVQNTCTGTCNQQSEAVVGGTRHWCSCD